MRKIVIVATAMTLATAAYAGDPAAGKEKSKLCATCHGETGATPTDPANPKLAGQYYDYLVRALSDYKSGARKDPVMTAMVVNLKRQDIADIAAYFSSQQALATKY